MHDNHDRTKRLAVLGVPVHTGQARPGVNKGPDFIRGNDLSQAIKRLGYVITDYGNMDTAHFLEDHPVYFAKLPKAFIKNCLDCRTMMKHALDTSDCVLVLGGDRSLTTGSILGHQGVKNDICVICVSSKPNLHNPLSLPSGHLNRMPFFLLLDKLQNEIPWLNDFRVIPPILPAKSLGIIGVNEVDNYERYVINKCGIKVMSIVEIDRLGIDAVVRETLMTVNPGLTKSIHLCFCCDSLDVMFGPCAADTKAGGLTLREVVTICEVLFDTGLLSVIEITEVNPEIGSSKEGITTRETIKQIILTALGAKRRGVGHIDPNYYSWTLTNVHRGAKFKK